MDNPSQDVNLSKMKERRRRELASSRKKSRSAAVKSKRFRADMTEEDMSFSIKTVKEASRAFQKKKGENTVAHLKYLRNAFAESSKYIDAFLEVDNALYSLIGYLTGNNASLQLEAICCLTNISASENKNIHTIVKATSAYLITFLRSGSVLLQDQSAWALANMAADNEKTRELLKAQGIIEPLVGLIESEVDEVVQSSFFALCNLCKSPALFVPDLIKKHNLLAKIHQKLKISPLPVTTVGEIMWLLTHFTFTESSTLEMVAEAAGDDSVCGGGGGGCGLVNVLMGCVSRVKPGQEEYQFVVLPIVRCIGNIFGCIDLQQAKQLQLDSSSVFSFLRTLNSILTTCQTRDFVTKECLWTVSNLFALGCLDALLVATAGGKIEAIDDCDIGRESVKLVSNVSMHLNSFSNEIKKQAGIFICNVLFSVGNWTKDNTYNAALNCCLSENVFQSFVSFLKSEDDELVWIAVNFIRTRLVFKQKLRVQCRQEGVDNSVQADLYWTDGCDGIMNGVVQYLQVLRHHQDDNVKGKVFEILQDVS